MKNFWGDTMFEYAITNIVVSGKIGYDIDIYKLAMEEKNVVYEPEQFPGAKLKIGIGTFLIFHNGAFILAGAKTEAEIQDQVEKLEPIISKYKRIIPEGDIE